MANPELFINCLFGHFSSLKHHGLTPLRKTPLKGLIGAGP